MGSKRALFGFFNSPSSCVEHVSVSAQYGEINHRVLEQPGETRQVRFRSLPILSSNILIGAASSFRFA
jgi:hypothetical protein